MSIARHAALRAVAGAMVVAALVGVMPAGAAGASGDSAGEQPPVRPRRVLLVSFPRLTWRQVVDQRPKTILGLLDHSAVASLSLRTIGPRTSLGEGYATMGAGNRAGISDGNAGTALGPEERFEDGTAAATYARRTGRSPLAAVLQLDIASVVQTNERLLYGAVPGSLGHALARNGWQRAVIGNGDYGVEGVPALTDLTAGSDTDTPGGQPQQPSRPGSGDGGDPGSTDPTAQALPTDTLSSLNRALALSLMDTDGTVPRGDVSRDLLLRDPRSPFGLKMNGRAVMHRFRQLWRDRAVVTVEMSDLERADRYARAATAGQADAMRSRALVNADRLLAGILTSVDPKRDLVLLVAPAAPREHEEPTPFAMRGPGIRPGITQSGTTRRAGYVTLPDIAPTILHRLGISQPTAMTGTLIADAGHGGTGPALYRSLASRNRVTRFRDTVAGPVSVWFVVFSLVGYAFAVLSLTGRRQGLRPWSAFIALMILAFPTVTFLFGLVRAEPLGFSGFLVAVFVASAVLALIAQHVGFRLMRRHDPRAAMVPPLLLIAAMYVLQILDVVTGGRMQINTVFGYSPVVAGRFAGYGNLSFALLAMSTVVLSTGLWGLARIQDKAMDGPRSHVGLAVVIGLFLVAVVADGYPAFGSDVGGVLALVPAGAVITILLSGRRFDLRKTLLIGGVTAVVLGLFAGLDLARPPQDRTHLGRLVASTVGGGGGGLGTVLNRKLSSNLHVLTSSTFIWAIPAALAFLAFLTWRRRGFVRSLMDVVPGSRACLWGGIVVAVLGFALNDSGMAVPAMMFPVLLPYLIHLVVQPDSGPDAQAPKWLETLLARFERDDVNDAVPGSSAAPTSGGGGEGDADDVDLGQPVAGATARRATSGTVH